MTLVRLRLHILPLEKSLSHSRQRASGGVCFGVGHFAVLTLTESICESQERDVATGSFPPVPTRAAVW